MKEEIWKTVVGYDGDYQVSNLGRVKSLKKKGGIKELILKQRKTTPSAPVRYWRVDLYKDGTQKSHLVSHLVLEAFVSPRPEGMEACHGPNGALDNSLSNLYWGTHEQNMKDKVRDGTAQNHRGENNPRTNLKDEDVIGIKKILSEGNMGREEIAKIYNVLPQVITNIKTGISWGWLEVDGFTPNGAFKITKSNAIAIKKMLAEGNLKQREIAEIFNINQCTVSKIKTGVALNKFF